MCFVIVCEVKFFLQTEVAALCLVRVGSRLSCTQSNYSPIIKKENPWVHQENKSSISFSEIIFKQPTILYNNARRSRFIPPFIKNIINNVVQTFLKIINKRFPKSSCLLQIFNWKIVKVSYSCMENMNFIIKCHSKPSLNDQPSKTTIYVAAGERIIPPSAETAKLTFTF